MAKKTKYYVVWVGAKPGIYASWGEASAQVTGYPDAKFKSFPNRTQAEVAYNSSASSARTSSAAFAKTSPSKARKPAGLSSQAPIIKQSLSVDAACSGNPGKMEYQGVDTDTQERLFHQAFELGTNNIGEFLAIVHALAWCKSNGLDTLPIYSDSKIALGWIAKKKCKTTLPIMAKTAKLHELIERGEAWLTNNTYKNRLLKWETERWGEIPADFGRK